MKNETKTYYDVNGVSYCITITDTNLGTQVVIRGGSVDAEYIMDSVDTLSFVDHIVSHCDDNPIGTYQF